MIVERRHGACWSSVVRQDVLRRLRTGTTGSWLPSRRSLLCKHSLQSKEKQQNHEWLPDEALPDELTTSFACKSVTLGEENSARLLMLPRVQCRRASLRSGWCRRLLRRRRSFVFCLLLLRIIVPAPAPSSPSVPPGPAARTIGSGSAGTARSERASERLRQQRRWCRHHMDPHRRR